MKRFVIILIFIFTCINLHAQVNVITTIGGTGVPGYSGDNGPATSAKIYFPEQLCLDDSGNVLIADSYNHRIRKIDISTSVMSRMN